MTRKAVVEIGSNSVKLFVAELGTDTMKYIIDQNCITRLGERLKETGEISAETMDKNCQVIKEFVKLASEKGADEIIGVGTAALRNAKNTNQFSKMTRDKCGLDISILSPEDEARLTYLAVYRSLNIKEEITVFDTGGGSTELIYGKAEEIYQKQSFALGAVGISEQFLLSDPVTEEEVSNALRTIRKTFDTSEILRTTSYQLVGVGGTVTTLGLVKHKMDFYDPDIIHGSTITLEEINTQIELFRQKTISQRKEIIGLYHKRADIILAGACIVKVIMEMLSAHSMIISNHGLRHGVLYNMFLQLDD